MGCACIKKIFDLSVKPMGLTKMVIEDQSVWMDDAGFDHGLNIDVHIKSLTGRGIDFTIPLAVKRQNILTAKELYGGTEETCIPDDLYCFTIGPEGPGACGELISITRAFLPGADCALHSLRANAKDAKDEQIALEVWRMIGKIHSQIELNRVEGAKDTYELLKNKLKSLRCDCCD